MLCLNPVQAQVAARQFQGHLLRLTITTRTPYDSAWLDNARMMDELGSFCDLAVPCLLWHNNCASSTISVFCAVRALGADDSVMDSEGVHGRWKWIAETRRRVNMPSLNAILKLTAYLESYGDFPPNVDLLPHLNSLRKARNLMSQRFRQDGTVNEQLTRGWYYKHRFNLLETDVELLRQKLGTAPTLPSTAEVAWGQYLRFLLQPGMMYRASLLTDRALTKV